MNRNKGNNFLGVLALCLALAFCSQMSSAQDSDKRMLDFVVMSEGHGLEERDIYTKKVESIAKRYGMVKERSFNTNKFMVGDAALAEVVQVNVWKVPSGAMKSLSQDSDYQALLEYRNHIHDMKAVSIYLAEPDTIKGIATGAVMVDLVVMKPGFGLQERKNYEAKVEPITKKYGMSRFASYDINKKQAGLAPTDSVSLNFWNIESTEKMKLVSKDPAYQELLAYRNKIHDMSKVTLFMAEPNKK